MVLPGIDTVWVLCCHYKYSKLHRLLHHYIIMVLNTSEENISTVPGNPGTLTNPHRKSNISVLIKRHKKNTFLRQIINTFMRLIKNTFVRFWPATDDKHFFAFLVVKFRHLKCLVKHWKYFKTPKNGFEKYKMKFFKNKMHKMHFCVYFKTLVFFCAALWHVNNWLWHMLIVLQWLTAPCRAYAVL